MSTQSTPTFRLFCFPYAGAGAHIFKEWSRFLPTWLDIYPVDWPGRGTRITEPALCTMSEVLAFLQAELIQHMDIPYAFFGHSQGALICFELTRQLHSHAYTMPHMLLLSAHKAPQLLSPPIFHPNQSDAELITTAQKLGGMPPEVIEQQELMQLFLQTLRTDISIRGSYIYTETPPLPCPITAFGGLQDPLIQPAELASWSEQTASTFQLQLFPGNHFFWQKKYQLQNFLTMLLPTITQHKKTEQR